MSFQKESGRHCCVENSKLHSDGETIEKDDIVAPFAGKKVKQNVLSQKRIALREISNALNQQTETPTSTSSSVPTSSVSRTQTHRDRNSVAQDKAGQVENITRRRLNYTHSPNGTTTPLTDITAGNRELLKKILENQEKILAQNKKLVEENRRGKIHVHNEIRQAVREAYNNIVEQNNDEETEFKEWNFQESRRYPDNVRTSQEVQRCVKGWHPDAKSCKIRVAVERYYRSLYEKHLRMKNDKNEDHKARQRTYERRKRKLKARSAVLEKSGKISDEQKAKYKKVLTMDFISSEYSVTDDDNSTVFAVSKLPWRSEEVNRMFHALDEKHMSCLSRGSKRMLVKRAEAEERSPRGPPRKYPSFAVKREIHPNNSSMHGQQTT